MNQRQDSTSMDNHSDSRTATHTKGPWLCWDDGRTIGIEDGKGESIAIMEIVDHGDMADDIQLRADQTLAASAPDLLAQLRIMTSLYENLQGHETAGSRRAKAVIVQATTVQTPSGKQWIGAPNDASGPADGQDSEHAAKVSKLADAIDVLAAQGIDGTAPMIVDGLAEGWRIGLESRDGEDAIRLVAGRGTSIVCSPLADLDRAAAILPNPVRNGMTAEHVRDVLGNPDQIEVEGDDAIWLHGLPFSGREGGEGDGAGYAERQKAWMKSDGSQRDLPHAPLVAGERMYLATTFSKGFVSRTHVVVKRIADVDADDDGADPSMETERHKEL